MLRNLRNIVRIVIHSATRTLEIWGMEEDGYGGFAPNDRSDTVSWFSSYADQVAEWILIDPSIKEIIEGSIEDFLNRFD